MTKEKRTNPFKDEFDGEYIGNVFGWKFSLIGAVVIFGFVAFYAYLRYQQINNPPTDIEIKNSVDHIDTQKTDTLDIH